VVYIVSVSELLFLTEESRTSYSLRDIRRGEEESRNLCKVGTIIWRC